MTDLIYLGRNTGLVYMGKPFIFHEAGFYGGKINTFLFSTWKGYFRNPRADPGFVERGGGAAATASAAGAKVFGGSRLKTLFGISKGVARAPAPPPPNPLVYI